MSYTIVDNMTVTRDEYEFMRSYANYIRIVINHPLYLSLADSFTDKMVYNLLHKNELYVLTTYFKRKHVIKREKYAWYVNA